MMPGHEQQPSRRLPEPAGSAARRRHVNCAPLMPLRCAVRCCPPAAARRRAQPASHGKRAGGRRQQAGMGPGRMCGAQVGPRHGPPAAERSRHVHATALWQPLNSRMPAWWPLIIHTPHTHARARAHTHTHPASGSPRQSAPHPARWAAQSRKRRWRRPPPGRWQAHSFPGLHPARGGGWVRSKREQKGCAGVGRDGAEARTMAGAGRANPLAARARWGAEGRDRCSPAQTAASDPRPGPPRRKAGGRGAALAAPAPAGGSPECQKERTGAGGSQQSQKDRRRPMPCAASGAPVPTPPPQVDPPAPHPQSH